MTNSDSHAGVCRICNNTANNLHHTAYEMLFGTREAFDYIECPACGTVQISAVPENLGQYYPKGYYSYAKPIKERQNWLTRKLKQRRVAYALYHRSLVGMILAKIYGYWPYYDWFRAAKIQQSDSILDLGCGSGEFLLRLQSEGFTNLRGADPFIEKTIAHDNGVKIFKQYPHELSGQFDVVMMHHVFEHVPNPREILATVRRLLRPNGVLLLSMPVVGWAWKHYGVNWIQLDPPRHLYVYTQKGFDNLAKEAGFNLIETFYNSTSFLFTGSEMYKRGLSFYQTAPGADPVRRDLSKIFTSKQIAEFDRQAAELNGKRAGDQACFVLRRV
ncbi:MAG TPA: class I SAM-dependent methyltransferase [Phycisphaerae bacterium]|nr:class I SAM-dependent methyltransferase [Phycisphaerae bacterium]